MQKINVCKMRFLMAIGNVSFLMKENALLLWNKLECQLFKSYLEPVSSGQHPGVS